MVALKLALFGLAGVPEIAKQERRGGIETFAHPVELDLPKREAGTPWWH